MRRMSEAARQNGLAGFRADVLAGNRGMLMIFQKSGLCVQSWFDGAVYHLEMRFEAAGAPAFERLSSRPPVAPQSRAATEITASPEVAAVGPSKP